MQHFTISEAGLALTKQFEGLRLRAYRDSGGVWTVGYGHTGADVHAGLVVTEPEAEALLRADLATAVACVNEFVTAAIEQHHFDALMDFAFNVGCANYRRSTLLRLINAGDFTTAAAEFGKWTHVDGKQIEGLVRRRAAEVTLFRTQPPR